MTDERRLQIEQHANLYGSANGWAGTSGTLATMIRELMVEVDTHRKLLNRAADMVRGNYGWIDGSQYCDDLGDAVDELITESRIELDTR